MKGLKYLLFSFVILLIAFNNTNAETCTYSGTVDGAEFTYKCSISAENPVKSMACSFVTDANILYKKYENGTISSSNSSNTYKMKIADYLENDEVDCSNVPSLKFDIGVTSLQEIHVYNIGANISGGIASSVNSDGVADYTYAGTSTFRLINNSGNTGTVVEEEETEFSTSNFCTGAIEGAFTTLGWVFFFIKILIPIILIVFGSIDFGKAILSSKDDEIKKSAKTLVMRSIAGIIIFFIPTLLNFVVELIGGNDIYNEDSGTFARCTHCMLEPTDDSCRKLVN